MFTNNKFCLLLLNNSKKECVRSLSTGGRDCFTKIVMLRRNSDYVNLEIIIMRLLPKPAGKTLFFLLISFGITISLWAQDSLRVDSIILSNRNGLENILQGI